MTTSALILLHWNSSLWENGVADGSVQLYLWDCAERASVSPQRVGGQQASFYRVFPLSKRHTNLTNSPPHHSPSSA